MSSESASVTEEQLLYWWLYVRQDIRHPGVANSVSLLQPPVLLGKDCRERTPVRPDTFVLSEQTAGFSSYAQDQSLESIPRRNVLNRDIKLV